MFIVVKGQLWKIIWPSGHIGFDGNYQAMK